MGKFIDMTGLKISRLTFIKKVGVSSSSGGIIWECICECGKVVNIEGSIVRKGKTKSCGCLNDEQRRKPGPIIHGGTVGRTKERLYVIWNHMKGRCLNKNNQKYKHYGGRGIKVCKQWLNSDGFINFRNWAKQNGYADNLTIDRIDNNGNYEPNNCRWASQKQQQNNRGNNIILTYCGISKTLSDWALKTGINADSLRRRVHNKWSVEKILTTPIRCK